MIYLLKSIEYEKLENGEYDIFFVLKIGYTEDETPDLMKNKRLSMYYSHHRSIELLTTIANGTEDQEKKLHYKFKLLRWDNSNEWYVFSQDIVDYIKSVTLEELDSLPFPTSSSRIKPGLAKIIVSSLLPIKDNLNRKQEIDSYVKTMSEKLGKEVNIEDNIIEYLRNDPNIDNTNIDKYLKLKSNRNDIIYSLDESINQEVKSFLHKYNGLTVKVEKMKLLCEYDMSDEAKKIVIGQIPDDDEIKGYYVVLGPERMHELGYNVTLINKDLGIVTFSPELLVNTIYDEFKIGDRILLSDLKTKLSDIYKRINYSASPKAKDIQLYFEIKDYKETVNIDGVKKRAVGYELVSSHEQEMRDKLKTMKS